MGATRIVCWRPVIDAVDTGADAAVIVDPGTPPEHYISTITESLGTRSAESSGVPGGT